ncbi:BT1926 family outer membrane beta-barrel protein [Dysgonomonas sp. ZJ709]|uniref:BT1926 family outer membrane beta-barrel protein n=1 Tax=Dysgonomonas sp. ZJ709 TaxID=2709797 RepID=UPI0013EBD9CF|nr:BT1926 family outer membrane beta-barrel protein [Dysgonomonas sp. ZJ709]
MKKIICLVMLLSFAFMVSAQGNDFEPLKKGDLMVSLNLGVGSYIGKSAPEPNLSEYTLSAPMSSWFDNKMILSVEGRWFLTDKWALKLTGGFDNSHNPGYTEVTGTGDELGDVPTYNAVPSSNSMQFYIGAGADHYFKTRYDQLYLRIGGEFGFAYGRMKANGSDSEKYMGASVGEAYSWKVAPVVGADYFFSNALFVGFDVRPVSYQYSVYNIRPQAGLGLLSSDNHNISVIAQPMLKLGIRF